MTTDIERSAYNGNTLLKPANVTQEWTKEQVEDYLRCKNDPVYFAETHCKIVHVDHGLIQYTPYDYQKELIQKLHDNRFVIGMQSRQTGKCFDGNTKIKVRNKKTGEIVETTIGEFYKKLKNGSPQNG